MRRDASPVTRRAAEAISAYSVLHGAMRLVVEWHPAKPAGCGSAAHRDATR
jgi:hypothetical protein